MGPKNRPIAPKAFSPPSTPNNTSRKGILLVPLMINGRIILSMVLTANKPQSQSPTPARS